MSNETRKRSDRGRQRLKRERDAEAGLADPRVIDSFLVRAIGVVLRDRHESDVRLAWRRKSEIGEVVEIALRMLEEAGYARESRKQIARVLHRVGDGSWDGLLATPRKLDVS
ncbi:hypothetical protein [Methylosinus sp. PW1]|uniref:hypothetical protein n=1 Tax=Methylosinus sp. PW1 TaxID=107636 RepID=UPI00056BAA87|nr:hypothetical protein [Methylosinus sp. PW1]